MRNWALILDLRQIKQSEKFSSCEWFGHIGSKKIRGIRATEATVILGNEEAFLLPLVSMFRSNAFAMAAKLSLEKVQSVLAAKARNVPKVH